MPKKRKKLLIAGGPSYDIDPTGHKKKQKTEKIHKKATQGSGSEKDWLKKTGPQLPLAKKNKSTKPLTEKSDTPYGQPEKAKKKKKKRRIYIA